MIIQIYQHLIFDWIKIKFHIFAVMVTETKDQNSSESEARQNVKKWLYLTAMQILKKFFTWVKKQTMLKVYGHLQKRS